MNRNAISGIMLTILIVSLFGIANIPVVESDDTIYIYPTGVVSPHTAPIERDEDLYTITADINDSIVIQCSNITLDGNGHTVLGDGTTHGFDLSHVENVILKNTKILNFSFGIFVYGSSNITLSGNNASYNRYDGIYSGDSVASTVINNTFLRNMHGIFIDSGSYNILHNNTVSNSSTYGIRVEDSEHNTLTDNTVLNGYFAGIAVIRSEYNKLEDNIIINNRFDVDIPSPGIFLENSTDTVISGNNVLNNFFWFSCGICVWRGCSGATLSSNNVSNNWSGITVYTGGGNTITSNRASNNRYGIEIDFSDSNILTSNIALNNTVGVQSHNSTQNKLEGNIASNNNYGIVLSDSSDNTVTGNMLTNNEYGICLNGSDNNRIKGNFVMNNSWAGASIESGKLNSIFGNDVMCNHRGIELDATGENVIRGNIIASSIGSGIHMTNSRVNSIYYNNLIENAKQVEGDTLVDNVWNQGVKGNHWSDYAGQDLNGDCVGDTDTPHLGVDGYPLMVPWTPMEGDLNVDGIVDIFDVVSVAKNFGKES